MNEQDFILLMEKHFEGSLSKDERAALLHELQADPSRRSLFESQSRQNMRLYAQTTPIDFTESQRIAISIIDTVSHHRHPASFADILKEQSFRERLNAIREGLHAPRHSGKYRYARFVILRFFAPPIIAIAVSLLIILVLISLVPKMFPVERNNDDTPTITIIQKPSDETPDRIAPPPDAPLNPILPSIVLPPDVPGVDTPEPLTPPVPLNPGFPAQPPPPVPSSFKPARPTSLPSIFANRAPSNRIDIIRRIPRGAETERAVTNALHWLKNHQRPDGSWAGQDPSAMTGLALLAFLAYGETPDTPAYGTTVKRALQFLLTNQDASGYFSKNVYAHAIATYAITEAFTMTRMMNLRAAMDRGIAIIIAGQQSSGGFDYNYAKGSRFDTSVAGWQIQAMKASLIAGADHPPLRNALQKSIHFLQTLSFAHDGSGFVYSGDNSTPPDTGAKWTMTGVGTLCLQLLGSSSAPQVRQGLKLLGDIAFDWPRDAKPSVYGFYYVTQAKFQSGNLAAWNRWNREMQQALLAAQHPDGHWEGGDYDQGSHVYTTTLCTLMLEVYYRYLPTFMRSPENMTSTMTDTSEVRVDVQ